MRSRRIVSWVVAIPAGAVAEIGVFAVMITVGQRLPAAYIAAHFLKVLGGMAGGLVMASRRRSHEQAS